ncbi:MAG: lysophospholipid acyltransferase family protein [Burkholderiales bacterium]|nr:lysophospholipid acyltransferase family protein [Burkholderiales bacterium]
MLNFLFRAASRLPLPVLHWAGALIGRLIYRCSAGFRRNLDANLAQAGYTSAHLRAAAVRESGKTIAELPAIWLRPPDQVARLVVETRGWEHIERCHRAGQAILFLTPHLGCFEITAQIYAHRAPPDRPITVLYRRPRKAALNPLLEAGRSRPNLRSVPADFSGVRAMIRALRRGEAAGLLPDQAPRFGEGAWAPFFGRPAYTMTLVRRLARAADARILLAFAERLPRGRGYRLEVRPFDAVLDDDMGTALAQINAALEALIRACPSQYLWSYDRYKAPPGRPGSAPDGEGAGA